MIFNRIKPYIINATIGEFISIICITVSCSLKNDDYCENFLWWGISALAGGIGGITYTMISKSCYDNQDEDHPLINIGSIVNDNDAYVVALVGGDVN